MSKRKPSVRVVKKGFVMRREILRAPVTLDYIEFTEVHACGSGYEFAFTLRGGSSGTHTARLGCGNVWDSYTPDSSRLARFEEMVAEICGGKLPEELVREQRQRRAGAHFERGELLAVLV